MSVQIGKRAQTVAPSRSNRESSPFTTAAERDRAPRILGALPPSPSTRRPANARELSEELAGMAASIGEVDPRASERLRDLADSIGTDDGRLRWADVDLRRAFNTEHLAHAYAVRREGGYSPKSIDQADKVRNILVFMPIFLTWFALFEAVRAYNRYITAHPDEIRLPFLLLWHRGFGGDGSIFATSFSTVAIIDAMIIGLIIALTFFSHGRREEHEDSITATALSFQISLDNVLAEATVALAPDRAGRPAMLARSVDRMADRFDVNSQELLTRLKVEHDRLDAISQRREKEFSDFGVFASGMRAGAEETHKLLLDLRQVSGNLQHTLEDMTTEVGAAGDQQRALFAAVTSLERIVATGIQSDHGVTKQLTEAARALADAADTSLAGAEAAAQAGRVATDAVRGIAEMSSALAASQMRVENALSEEHESNARLADALRTSSGGVNATAKLLSDIQGTLGNLHGEFARIAEYSKEQSTVMSRLLTEQSTISSGLAQVAREISANAGGGPDASALIRRLDSLTSALSQASGAATAAAASTAPEPKPASPSAPRSILPNAPDLFTDPLETPAANRARGLWPRRDER
jgi:hypothetical protein